MNNIKSVTGQDLNDLYPPGIGDGTGITSYTCGATIPTTRCYTVHERDIVRIGNDFDITGKELKICLRMLLKQVKAEAPEDFV
jgi:hypothetical protein